MASKKKSPKAKPVKRAPKPAAKAKKAAPAKRAKPKSGTPAKAAPKKLRATPPKALQAFSKQVLKEEEAPVAVRSFNEARAGVVASKEYVPKTGQTHDAPRLEPLSGPAAVPKPRQDVEFHIEQPKKGKAHELQTKDDLGKIELRQQRGGRDVAIANASPDYLQRGLKQATESGRITASEPERAHKKTKAERFKVKEDEPESDKDSVLEDFGEIEIAQQTRRGRKTLGTLDQDED